MPIPEWTVHLASSALRDLVNWVVVRAATKCPEPPPYSCPDPPKIELSCPTFSAPVVWLLPEVEFVGYLAVPFFVGGLVGFWWGRRVEARQACHLREEARRQITRARRHGDGAGLLRSGALP